MFKFRQFAQIACFTVLGSVALVHHAFAAEVDEIKIAAGYGIGYLPLAVMQENKLVEKRLQEQGLPSTKVVWSQAGSGSVMNDALIAGQLHFASGGIPPFLILWDKTRGSLDVKGVGTLCSMPNYLNTRNPNIKSIKDFTEKDRIAMAGAGSSVQTIYLQMEAAKVFGEKNYNKLNTLMINLPHPEGMTAMLAGQEINSHFTAPPFQYKELKVPGVHRVLSSYDIMGGSVSSLMVWGTSKFRKENPKSYAAVVAALNEAIDWINADKKRAAELYLKTSKGKETREEVESMLNDPEIKFTATPEKTMMYMDFQHRTGSLKNKAASWKDLFFPEYHQLSGS